VSRPDSLRSAVQDAFAESVRAIWLVLIPFVRSLFFPEWCATDQKHPRKCGIGFISAIFMKALPLQSVTDEVRATDFKLNAKIIS
jgi:hypothetical protein